METKEKKVKIAVYGSLRVNQYNYQHFVSVFGEENFKYIKTVLNVPGFLLYSLGAYPAILEDSEKSNPLIVDIMECSPEVHSTIRLMEIGAGYYEKCLEIDGMECIIYVYGDNSISTMNHLVESGNWTHHLATRKFSVN